MRYEVRCTNRACYLRESLRLPDLVAAEILAYSHQQRFADISPAHVVILKDLNEVQPSQNPAGDGGCKGA